MTPYSLILADPPWKYQDYSAPAGTTHARARGAAKHYPTMALPQIKALPVADLASPDAVLFMWATWPLIDQGLATIEAWGFTFKTLAWEWVKTTKAGSPAMGMGRYTRSNPEPCLLAFRGKPVPVAAHDVIALIFAPRGQHSRKPAEQYQRIDRLYPDHGPRLELFATEAQPGWAVWGNELTAAPEAMAILGNPPAHNRAG